jgi:hypothetical protein
MQNFDANSNLVSFSKISNFSDQFGGQIRVSLKLVQIFRPNTLLNAEFRCKFKSGLVFKNKELFGPDVDLTRCTDCRYDPQELIGKLFCSRYDSRELIIVGILP